MGIRSVFLALPVLAATMLVGVTPAGASVPAPGGQPSAMRPAARILDDVFNSVSCTTQPDNPAIKSACTAVGFFADGPYIAGLLQSSFNSTWGSNTFGGARTVTDPVEISCLPQQFDIPSCVAVGETYSNASFPVQFVATGNANGMSPVVFHNPRGSTWSILDDVSCASATFCMVVGTAGTTRRTAHGLQHVGHATAYRWNGSLHALTSPAPAHARTSELAGVSCTSATSCMAVGNYTSAAGRSLPYSALWIGGKWRIQPARIISGKSRTLFQAVSCAAFASCIAVGDATGPGSTAFAEDYAGGRWDNQRIAAATKSAFIGVSCPTTTYCVAAGEHGSRALIEAWNGSAWSKQAVPATPAPFTTDGLAHVSCLTPAICTAVGFRHNPKVRFSFRTLALGWNGASWKIQKTFNE